MGDEFTVRVPKSFVQSALQTVMQMKGDLSMDDELIIIDWILNEKTGELDLLLEKKRVTIN